MWSPWTCVHFSKPSNLSEHKHLVIAFEDPTNRKKNYDKIPIGIFEEKNGYYNRQHLEYQRITIMNLVDW